MGTGNEDTMQSPETLTNQEDTTTDPATQIQDYADRVDEGMTGVIGEEGEGAE